MSDVALTTLEQLRRAAVEAAQATLAEARAELARDEARLHEARSAKQRCDEELQGQRAQFGGGQGIRALRLCEERIRALLLEQQGAAQRLSAAQAALNRARANVDERLRILLQAEAERRAVLHVLERNQQVADKQRERSDEDEAEALHRLRAPERAR